MHCELHRIRRNIDDTVSFAAEVMPCGERWRPESFIDKIFISHFVKLCQDATDYTSHFQMFVLVLKLIFIRFSASFMLTVVYDHDPKGKDGYIICVMPRYMALVTAVLALVSSVVMVHFHVCTYR
ncbi:hypothetical protein M405DRAFT_78714 [Rhizopogon salebrosus TDB-379]|nr:hypothetical protein M405DRAFT_78714 [Rhizopogon salebrosus TDB-379]